MKYLILTLAVLVLNTGFAHASAKQNCEVIAMLEPSKEESVYNIEIGNNKDAETGKPCFIGFISKQIAKVDGENIVTGKPVKLEYSSYSAMGEDGAVFTKEWKYIDVYTEEEAIKDTLAGEGSDDGASE